MMDRKISARSVATFGVLLAVSLMLGYVENLIPFDFAIPGIKLGLPNVVVLVILRKKGMKYALPFGLLRVVLSNLLFGSAVSMVYSVAGCLLSVCSMWAFGKCKGLGIAGVSLIGGIAHNIGQIFAAVILLSNIKILYYLPFLIVSGGVTGFAVGIGAGVILKKADRLLKF